MHYIYKLLFSIIKTVFKLYDSSNIHSNLRFIVKLVDYENSLLGKGATFIQPKKEIELIKKIYNLKKLQKKFNLELK
jgi:hypothetical protein